MMTIRNALTPPLFAAVALAVLAATLGLIGAGTLHGTLDDSTEDQVERLQRAGELETALLEMASHQQALLAVRTPSEMNTVQSRLRSTQERLRAAIQAGTEVEDHTGQRRLYGFRSAVEAYIDVTDRLLSLVERRSQQQTTALARSEGEVAFQRYLSALETARQWVDRHASLSIVPTPFETPVGPGRLSPDGWAQDASTADTSAANEVVAVAWSLRLATFSVALESRAGLGLAAQVATVDDRTRALTAIHRRLLVSVKAGPPALTEELENGLTKWLAVNHDLLAVAEEQNGDKAYALATGEANEQLIVARAAARKISEAAVLGVAEARQAASATYNTTLRTALPALLLALCLVMLSIQWAPPVHPPGDAEAVATQEEVATHDQTDALQQVTDDAFTIQDLIRRTDLLVAEAEQAAERVTDLGECFTSVASEVRQLAERTQTAAKEISELAVSSSEVPPDKGEVLDQILSDMEVMATLVIEMSAAAQAPINRGDAGQPNDDRVLAQGLVSRSWPGRGRSQNAPQSRGVD